MLKNNKTCKTLGFTLVELSIVLVIIGLLIGGILIGQSLIESSKQRALISQINQYYIAIDLFDNKYRSLPGDLADAFDLLGNQCGSNSNVLTSNSGQNGNGNGIIDWANSSGIREARVTMCHLSKSGLIGNSDFTIAGTQSTNQYRVGQNTAVTPYGNNVGLILTGTGSPNTNNTSDPNRAKYALSMGVDNFDNSFNSNTNGADRPLGRFFTVEQTVSLDRKIDDGIADSGLVRPGGRFAIDSLSCLEATGEYKAADSGAICVINAFGPRY